VLKKRGLIVGFWALGVLAFDVEGGLTTHVPRSLTASWEFTFLVCRAQKRGHHCDFGPWVSPFRLM
jgi:hypothetical protein